MKKIVSVFCIFTFIFSAICAKPKYISPNNDGVQDELEIPLQISDKRYVQGWSLVIMNEQKEVVRVIENKVSLPEKIGFKSFFKQIVTPKQGVPIPEKIVWNGAMTNGETAPDGKYFYYVTATDDNGNEGKTKEYEVVVDTLAPQVELAQISDKIFGEGAKASLKIRQDGSVEDKWTGTIKNVEGEVVKTIYDISVVDASGWIKIRKTININKYLLFSFIWLLFEMILSFIEGKFCFKKK